METSSTHSVEAPSPADLPPPNEIRINSRAKPFVKWAGGKTRLLPEILSRLPEKFNTYFEPFVGGGAVLFALSDLQPKIPKVISDMSPELVNAYRVVKSQPEELLEALQKLKYSKSAFYRIRNADRQSDYWVLSPVERAARFIYLNKTCFNGLYRVNSRGELNVPFGSYSKPKIADPENIMAASAALQQVRIERASFDQVLEWVTPGDLVYFDPPYAPLSETASFTTYDREGFTTEDQIRLRDLFLELKRRGVFALLSNSSSELIRQLYEGQTVEEITAPRAIGASGGSRGKVTELLIKNY